MDFSYGIAGLGVGGGGDRTSVQHDDTGGPRIVRGGAAAIQELAFEGGAISLRSAAAELLDVKGGHSIRASLFKARIEIRPGKISTQSSRRAQRRGGETHFLGKCESWPTVGKR